MRYIYLKPVKTADDQKRVKNHPKLSSAELSKLIDDKVETKIITPESLAKTQAHHDDFRKMVLKEAIDLMAQKKHTLSSIITKNFKPADQVPSMKDGDQTFMLNTSESQATDLFVLKSLRNGKAHDARLYNVLYNEIKPLIKTAAPVHQNDFKKLPISHNSTTPNLYIDLSTLAKLGLQVGSLGQLLLGDPTAAGPEQGEGNKGDQYQYPSCIASNPQLNPKGLLKNCNFALRNHLTSVKNQGHRGSCSAFGTVAAIETKTSVRYGKKVNLSEQDLYKMQKLDWTPNPFDDYFDDGYNPPISAMQQLLSGYIFPFENEWEYNPSTQRITDTPHHKYTHSCDLYTGFCSDTNHQSHKQCYVMDIKDTVKVVDEVCEFIEGIPLIGLFAGWVCHSVTKWVEEVVGTVEVCIYDTHIAGSSNLKLSDFSIVWDPLFQTDIEVAKLALSHQHPMIFCFTVPNSFSTGQHSATDGKGFVVYNAAEVAPANAGGHCVEMVGYIDNSKLPAKANLTPGAGGGYFIIKNSWGKCFGDCGYAYLPASWVDKWGTMMVGVTGVQRL